MNLNVKQFQSAEALFPGSSAVPGAVRSERFFNRDLSLLEFFRRVLGEALDESLPLLERLKFLSIFSANLDEFFMIRVSGLKEKIGVKVSPDGRSAAEILAALRPRVTELIATQMNCLNGEVLPGLSAEGIRIAAWETLGDEERNALDEFFRERIYPVLTPQAVDPAHPFPYISGGSLNLGLFTEHRPDPRAARSFGKQTELFVRIKIPPCVPRLIPAREGATRFVTAEELIARNIRRLVPEAAPEDCFAFRITRDADIEVREAEAGDLLEMMEQNLKQKRFGDVVRLEVAAAMQDKLVEYLTRSLEIEPADVYRIDGLLSVGDLMTLYKLDRPDLRERPLRVARPAALASPETLFERIGRSDVLLHHPYMPYDLVTDFLEAAAVDPDVLAIKICLYRTGPDSPIPPILIEASERGKQVTALVELKARFDERNNIEWAKKLERAGVHVIYGLLGLKTHCKTTLIVRREGARLRRYVHLATGNYNPETSAVYTDLGLLTADEEIGADATELFNFLTAYSRPDGFRKLLVAPLDLRARMLELIGRETANAHRGRPARIVAKLNRLADVPIIEALYEASQAGVEINLIVRGICLLRPGVEGLSENIRVRSTVGRLLEHSRVYRFENGGEPLVYIGSSDWMPRNLDRRVEVLAPVEDAPIKAFILEEYLPAYLRDTAKSHELLADGSYRRIAPAEGTEAFNCQLSFQNHSNIVEFTAGKAAQGGIFNES